jgi:hypothetical protein
MTSNRKTNLTINIYADDQLRSTTMKNNNTIGRIQSNSIQMLYPRRSDMKSIPSVPVCHQQRIGNDYVDRKIEVIFE